MKKADQTICVQNIAVETWVLVSGVRIWNPISLGQIWFYSRLLGDQRRYLPWLR